MALSKTRVSVLLVALVVLAALGISLLGAVGSASPKDNGEGHHNTSDKGHSNTLTVVAKTVEARVVELGPQGPTHGDVRVVNAPLYNESGKEKVGRIDLVAVMTDPADEPNEKAHMTERTFTYTLPGGEISVQGMAPYPKFDRPAPGGVDAITGGTGKYAGVEGEVRTETRGNKVINTFHFIN